MSRYNHSGSTGHQCQRLSRRDNDTYIISWIVDYYGDRLRYPRTFRRITDGKGARKFCKKWNIPFEE